MTQRPQVQLTFIYGQERKINYKFNDVLIHHATSLCGGCTLESVNGYWRSGGAGRQHTFSGNVQQEDSYRLTLTCEPDKVDFALESMQQAFKSLSEVFATDIDWVHTTITNITGAHFSCKA